MIVISTNSIKKNTPGAQDADVPRTPVVIFLVADGHAEVVLVLVCQVGVDGNGDTSECQ